MSDVFWNAIIVGIVTILLAWMNLQTRKVVDKVHVLTNSGLGLQLRINAVMARRLATMTGDPIDQENAVNAERLLAEHDVKQSQVDQEAKP